MNIFVAGGGRVGFHLARLLCLEGHDVTVIETNPGRVEQTDATLDVRTVPGSATSVMLLKEAGVSSADLFIAVTGFDEGNLIAAATAKSLGSTQVVARVRDANYLESHILYETILGCGLYPEPGSCDGLGDRPVH